MTEIHTLTKVYPVYMYCRDYFLVTNGVKIYYNQIMRVKGNIPKQMKKYLSEQNFIEDFGGDFCYKNRNFQ